LPGTGPFFVKEVEMPSRYPVSYSSQRSLGAPDPLSDFRRDMDRLFDAFFGGGGALAGGASTAAMAIPRVDIREDERELCVTADMPGVKPSEVDLRLEGDVLVISGERRSEAECKEENFHLMERGHGRFRRSVQLPFTPDPDQVHADYDHGVLTVRMPMQPQAQRSRRIEVRGSGDADTNRNVEDGTQPRAPEQAAGMNEAAASPHH
jgi:HSP20 family protein